MLFSDEMRRQMSQTLFDINVNIVLAFCFFKSVTFLHLFVFSVTTFCEKAMNTILTLHIK